MLYSRHGHVVLGLDLKVHIFFQCQSTGFNSHIIVSECSGQDTAGVFKRKLGEVHTIYLIKKDERTRQLCTTPLYSFGTVRFRSRDCSS